MRTEEEIRREMAPLQRELQRVEDARKRAEYKKLLGKCFKYRNSYGSGSPDWWLYVRVIGGDGYWPKCFQFQLTSHGEIIIAEKEHSVSVGRDDRGYTEITRKEFDRAWAQMKRRIGKLNSR